MYLFIYKIKIIIEHSMEVTAGSLRPYAMPSQEKGFPLFYFIHHIIMLILTI